MINAWYTEYSGIAKDSKAYIDDAKDNFKTILEGDDMTNSLDNAKNSIDDIKESINSIKDSIGDVIAKYSDYIDDYGKLGFKIYFSVLIAIVGMIAILMLLLCFCSGGSCKYCCCFRCGFKIIIHLLWNILALFMIITFLLGFLFSFIGAIGKDMIYVVNYFISDENLSKEKPILFGSEGSKLNKCFNGNGDILKELGFNTNDISSFDQLKQLNEDILSVKQTFTSLINQSGTYSILMKNLYERVNYEITDFKVALSYDNTNGKLPANYKLSDLIEEINSNEYVAGTKKEIWNFNCQEGKTAEDDKICRNPRDVVNLENEYNDNSNLKAKEAHDILQIINKIMNLVKMANNENDHSSFKYLNKDLKLKYDNFLNSEINTLQIFNATIKDLTDIFDELYEVHKKIHLERYAIRCFVVPNL